MAKFFFEVVLRYGMAVVAGIVLFWVSWDIQRRPPPVSGIAGSAHWRQPCARGVRRETEAQVGGTLEPEKVLYRNSTRRRR
jgi:hypothetical protein